MEEHTFIILDYIHFCTEAVLVTKAIRVFPNQKPYVENNVRSLLRTRDAAMRSGHMVASSTTWRDLKKNNREAKDRYKQHIEGHFGNNDRWSMERGIKTLTENKINSTVSKNRLKLIQGVWEVPTPPEPV